MLTGVAAFLLLIIAILAIPVTLTFKLSWEEAFKSDTKLLWAFGLVRVRIPTDKTRTTSSQDQKAGQKRRKPEHTPGRKRNVFAAIRQASFRRRLIRFMRELWRAVHKEDLTLRLRLGLGDPADTGQLWAIVGPMAGVLANVPEASIAIEPEFLDATLELDSSGSIRLIPLQMIFLAGALLLSPAVWQGISQMRKVA